MVPPTNCQPAPSPPPRRHQIELLAEIARRRRRRAATLHARSPPPAAAAPDRHRRQLLCSSDAVHSGAWAGFEQRAEVVSALAGWRACSVGESELRRAVDAVGGGGGVPTPEASGGAGGARPKGTLGARKRPRPADGQGGAGGQEAGEYGAGGAGAGGEGADDDGGAGGEGAGGDGAGGASPPRHCSTAARCRRRFARLDAALGAAAAAAAASASSESAILPGRCTQCIQLCTQQCTQCREQPRAFAPRCTTAGEEPITVRAFCIRPQAAAVAAVKGRSWPPSVRGSVSRGLTAATPVDNPYCSCKPTRAARS